MIPLDSIDNYGSSDIDNVLSEDTMTLKPLTEDRNNGIDARLSSAEVDVIAARIGKQLGSDAGHHAFICKSIWELGEKEAQRLADLAQAKGKNPPKYFSWLVTKVLEETSLI